MTHSHLPNSSHPLRQLFTSGSAIGVLASAALFGAACEQDPVPDDPSSPPTTTLSQSALALSAQLPTDAAVTGVRFRVERVGCTPGESYEEMSYEHSGELEELTFPADLVPDQPLDSDSEHRFADHYVVLEAGCYDISATPLDGSSPSDVCSVARAEGVRVIDGETTEVTLISQCEGEATGGLDTAVGFNRPPTIDAVVYTPSKFVATCQMAEICVTASDPDSDPLELVFSARGELAERASFQLMVEANFGGSVERCIQVTPDQAGAYQYEVTAYDLLDDPDEGLIRFEDYLAQLGSTLPSHDSLSFPLYAQDAEQVCSPAPTEDAGNPNGSHDMGDHDMGNSGGADTGGGDEMDMGGSPTPDQGGSSDMSPTEDIGPSDPPDEEMGGGVPDEDMSPGDAGSPDHDDQGSGSDMGGSGEPDMSGDMHDPDMSDEAPEEMGDDPDMGSGGADQGHDPDMDEDMSGHGGTCQDLTNAQLRAQVQCTIQAGTVTFTIPAYACAETLTFSSYGLVGGLLHPLDELTLHDTITDTYGPGTHTLHLGTPGHCGYLTALYSGSVMATLDADHGHGARLVCQDSLEVLLGCLLP